MKMKKILSFVVAGVLGLSLLTACGKNDAGQTSGNQNSVNAEANTIGTKLYVSFQSSIADNDDIEAVANKLTENEVFTDLMMGVMPVEEGYLNGFDGEISGFDKGVMFAPMIGTIPFVGYIFESSDADGLAKLLDEKAMLNWNICTVADEKVVETSGNYVFFVMAPNSFE